MSPRSFLKSVPKNYSFTNLASHHENYTSWTNQTRRTLLEKQGQAHQWCTPMDPCIWPSKSRTTSSNNVGIRDVTLKTCQKRWAIGRSGERGSGISVLAARLDIYIYIYIYIWFCIKLLTRVDKAVKHKQASNHFIMTARCDTNICLQGSLCIWVWLREKNWVLKKILFLNLNYDRTVYRLSVCHLKIQLKLTSLD